jgi:hypothetical protein
MAKLFMMAVMFCGLCTAVQANTTSVALADGLPFANLIAQNDIAMPREPFDDEVRIEAVPMPSASPDIAPAIPMPLPSSGIAPAGPVRIGLLLPLRSSMLGSAAAAVRDGFLAAHEREKQGVSIDVVATDGTPSGTLAGYAGALARNDVVVGPLSRTEVAAVAQQAGAIGKPTIALAQPEAMGTTEAARPLNMLAVGFSIEDEARQVADWMYADGITRKTFALSTGVAWQRRAVQAFDAQWRAMGRMTESIKLEVIDGYLSPTSLVQLKQRLQEEAPEAMFVALDAGLAAQLRLAIGGSVPIYGTSQLNPLALLDWDRADNRTDMEGMRLLDMPWQLQPDHPAVMGYPRPAAADGQPYGADMARLYALGIDAYRIARAIAAHNTNFGLDGVTGKLTISFGNRTNRFRRVEQQAVYEGGKVVPLNAAQ